MKNIISHSGNSGTVEPRDQFGSLVPWKWKQEGNVVPWFLSNGTEEPNWFLGSAVPCVSGRIISGGNIVIRFVDNYFFD